ncbi:DnaJ domain-containing protein [Sorangium sp. So ce296]|uniref:DnaJ domain-containing protein n=1 Tax=Sorangium sp. So ce296 TaxID=3133296 RepID=UPI003F5E67E3
MPAPASSAPAPSAGVIYVAVAFGRPPSGYRCAPGRYTWAAWWRAQPDRAAPVRPDGMGGCTSRESGLAEAERIARAFGRTGPLEELPADWARWSRCGEWPEERAARKAEQDRRWREVQAEVDAELRAQAERDYQRFTDDVRRRVEEQLRRLLGDPAADAAALAALGLARGATAADVKRAYRQRALAAHPDRGGSHEDFLKLTAARDRALAVVGGA